RDGHQAWHEPRLRGRRERALLPGQDPHAVRRCPLGRGRAGARAGGHRGGLGGFRLVAARQRHGTPEAPTPIGPGGGTGSTTGPLCRGIEPADWTLPGMLVVALGLAAAALLAVGFVLQQHEAAAASGPLLRPGLLLALAHRPVWLGGVGAMVAGQLLSAT